MVFWYNKLKIIDESVFDHAVSRLTGPPLGHEQNKSLVLSLCRIYELQCCSLLGMSIRTSRQWLIAGHWGGSEMKLDREVSKCCSNYEESLRTCWVPHPGV